jgi:hypothetical protein
VGKIVDAGRSIAERVRMLYSTGGLQDQRQRVQPRASLSCKATDYCSSEHNVDPAKRALAGHEIVPFEAEGDGLLAVNALDRNIRLERHGELRTLLNIQNLQGARLKTRHIRGRVR